MIVSTRSKRKTIIRNNIFDLVVINANHVHIKLPTSVLWADFSIRSVKMLPRKKPYTNPSSSMHQRYVLNGFNKLYIRPLSVLQYLHHLYISISEPHVYNLTQKHQKHVKIFERRPRFYRCLNSKLGSDLCLQFKGPQKGGISSKGNALILTDSCVSKTLWLTWDLRRMATFVEVSHLII